MLLHFASTSFKGTVSRDFASGFFMNHLSQNGDIASQCAPPVSTIPAANNWINIRLLAPYSELEGIKLSMLTLLPKGFQTKYLKLFSLNIFPFATGITLSCENLREFSKKFETALMGYSGAWGKPIHEKCLK